MRRVARSLSQAAGLRQPWNSLHPLVNPALSNASNGQGIVLFNRLLPASLILFLVYVETAADSWGNPGCGV
jgi:hypothetical protein